MPYHLRPWTREEALIAVEDLYGGLPFNATATKLDRTKRDVLYHLCTWGVVSWRAFNDRAMFPPDAFDAAIALN